MSVFFVDRQSTYPNRCLITPQNGTPYYAVVERADEPIVVGTPLNAETFNGMADEILTRFHYESAEYPGCYYRMVDGEVEWINPPMHDGAEYRTTERSNGSPVYVKQISVDLPDQNNTFSAEIVRTNTQVALLNIDGSIRDDLIGRFYVYPFVNTGGQPEVKVEVQIALTIQGETILKFNATPLNSNVALSSARFSFKYIK